MNWSDVRRSAGRSVRLVGALLFLGSAVGCSGDGAGGAAVTARADVVDVTYYYLPG